MTRPSEAEVRRAIGRWGWVKIHLSGGERSLVDVEWRVMDDDEIRSTKHVPVYFATRDTVDDALRAVVGGEK